MKQLTKPFVDIFNEVENQKKPFKLPRRRRRKNTENGDVKSCNGGMKSLHTLRRSVKKKKNPGKSARQRQFLDAYISNLFSVAKAVRAVGISRSVYYHWRDNDAEFMEQLDDARESKKDFIENALMAKVAKGDIIAIIFASKCLLSDRGYLPDKLLKLDVHHSESKLNLSKEERDAVVAASTISNETIGLDFSKLRGTGKHHQPH